MCASFANCGRKTYLDEMLLSLASLIATFEWVSGMCYTEMQSTTAREVKYAFGSSSREECRQQGLTASSTESMYFSPTQKKCYYLGKATNATCGAPFTEDKKTTTGCPLQSPIINYYRDFCFNLPARTSSDKLKTEEAPICPNTPIDGEATARVYVVSLILPSGQYVVHDNNMQAIITWDDTNTTWVYNYQSGRDVYVNQPIYAASCAYHPAGTTGHNCPCESLPLESSTMSESTATTPTADAGGACPSGYSGIFIQAQTNKTHTCTPCNNVVLQCIGKLWIYTLQTGKDMDSFALSSGTCYQRPTAP